MKKNEKSLAATLLTVSSKALGISVAVEVAEGGLNRTLLG